MVIVGSILNEDALAPRPPFLSRYRYCMLFIYAATQHYFSDDKINRQDRMTDATHLDLCSSWRPSGRVDAAQISGQTSSTRPHQPLHPQDWPPPPPGSIQQPPHH